MVCVRFAVSADKGDISIYFVGAIRTHIPDVSGAARPRTPRFRSYGGCPPPHPGVHYLSFECPAGGGEDRGLRAGRPKVNRKTAKTKVLDSFVLTSLYQIWNIPATEFRSFSNLQFGGQRYFGCRPVKGGHVSVGA